MNDMGTKWRQRQLCYLEKLFSERNANEQDSAASFRCLKRLPDSCSFSISQKKPNRFRVIILSSLYTFLIRSG